MEWTETSKQDETGFYVSDEEYSGGLKMYLSLKSKNEAIEAVKKALNVS